MSQSRILVLSLSRVTPSGGPWNRVRGWVPVCLFLRSFVWLFVRLFACLFVSLCLLYAWLVCQREWTNRHHPIPISFAYMSHC